jgi:hypothetical protein
MWFFVADTGTRLIGRTEGEIAGLIVDGRFPRNGIGRSHNIQTKPARDLAGAPRFVPMMKSLANEAVGAIATIVADRNEMDLILTNLFEGETEGSLPGLPNEQSRW